MEVFSSIQGEGLLIGKRQVFIRFSGCNIDCNYCDTLESKDASAGEEYSVDELNKIVTALITPDVDSLEITGGEPLLHAEFIAEYLTKYPFKAMLETNATLPDKIGLLNDVIDIVSMDIKLPEHFATKKEWQDVYEKELKSIQTMQNHNMDYYIKIVVSPTTPLRIIEDILKDLDGIVSHDVEFIIQPVSPMENWHSKEKLFEISQKIGEKYRVSIIPQIHKYMEIE